MLTDASRLRQVLAHLASNAIKFSAGRPACPGRVMVRADLVAEAPLRLAFAVTDNGIGIAPEAAAALFEPFRQAEDSTTRRFGGTGLGLAIATRLIDLFGGDIQVDSALGRGSTFTVTLPVGSVAGAAQRMSAPARRERTPAPARKPAGAPSVEAARQAGTLVLLAEDDVVNRKVALRQLALLGHAAEVAVDGAEAWHLWQRGGYGLLLTDLHMPELDGCGLARRIRAAEAEAPGTPRLPIIALTANAQHDEAARVRAAGMDAYLTKPVRLEALGATLARWLPAPSAGAAAAAPAQAPAANESSSTRPAVDVNVLRNLIGADDADVRDFLAQYRDVAQRQGAEITAAWASGDNRGVATVAHKLKASSRSVGALALGDLCAELENAGTAGDAALLAAGCARFAGSMAAVQACLESFLAEPA